MYYSTCNILRNKTIEHGKFIGGELVIEHVEKDVIEPHGTPLFTEEETTTGVCHSCRQGWEVEGNTFANPKERARATQSQVKK